MILFQLIAHHSCYAFTLKIVKTSFKLSLLGLLIKETVSVLCSILLSMWQILNSRQSCIIFEKLSLSLSISAILSLLSLCVNLPSLVSLNLSANKLFSSQGRPLVKSHVSNSIFHRTQMWILWVLLNTILTMMWEHLSKHCFSFKNACSRGLRKGTQKHHQCKISLM